MLCPYPSSRGWPSHRSTGMFCCHREVHNWTQNSCHNVNCTNSALSLKQLSWISTALQSAQGLIKRAHPVRGRFGSEQRGRYAAHSRGIYFPKRFLNCWHSSFFYDSSCPTFQRALESSCLQFSLPRSCCLKFFQLSLPQAYISK